MREVYILENMAAGYHFMMDQMQKGYQPESFLGVGSFSSSFSKEIPQGADLKVTPAFLEPDLYDYIVKGYISLFENEPILIQPKMNINHQKVSKWLILSQHKTIFSLQKDVVLKYLRSESISSIEEFVNIYFHYLLSKTNELRAEVIIILMDFSMFLEYLREYFKAFPLNSPIEKSAQLEKNVIKEIVLFFSNAFFSHKIAIIPDQSKYYNIFLSMIHESRQESKNFSNDVMYKL